jgi:hypothetical protein
MAATWSFDYSVIYHSLHLRLAITNDLYLVIGIARTDLKVVIMQLGMGGANDGHNYIVQCMGGAKSIMMHDHEQPKHISS